MTWGGSDAAALIPMKLQCLPSQLHPLRVRATHGPLVSTEATGHPPGGLLVSEAGSVHSFL